MKKKILRHPKASKRSTSTQPFRLLDLPPELRQEIYSYALYRPSPRLVPPYTWVWNGWSHPGPTCLSLLLVCRQIYVEAYALFYRLNHFYFANTVDLYYFLSSIGSARRAEIKALRFEWLGESDETSPWSKLAFRLLKTCKRLERIQFGLGRYQLPGYAALREVRGLKVVKIKSYYIRDGKQTNELKADREELIRAMMRPRTRRDSLKEDEGIRLLGGKELKYRKPERERLLASLPPKWYFAIELKSLSKLRKRS